MQASSNRRGDSLGLALADADKLGFPEGEELGVFDGC
jgi:hypothetical protein